MVSPEVSTARARGGALLVGGLATACGKQLDAGDHDASRYLRNDLLEVGRECCTLRPFIRVSAASTELSDPIGCRIGTLGALGFF
jgi:hypothetical protein